MGIIKLVAIDLDGTLLKDNKTVSPRTIQTIQRCVEQGIHIVIATTRGLSFVKPFYEQLGLHDPIICTSGAEIWGTLEGPLWMRHTMPKSAAKSIARLADEHDWWLSTTINDMRYWLEQPNQKTINAPDLQYVKTNLEGVTDAPVRIVTKHTDAIIAIDKLCKQEFPDVCRPEIFHNPDGTLESLVVVAPQADKGEALKIVCEKLQVDTQYIMAIGDNNNDVPMLEIAGVGVAMGNALQAIKNKADIVTKSNEDDGVAEILEQYILQ